MALTPPKERLLRLMVKNPGSYVGYRTKVFDVHDVQIGKVAANTLVSLWKHGILEKVSRVNPQGWPVRRLRRPSIRFYLNTAAVEVRSLKQLTKIPLPDSSGPVTMWDHLLTPSSNGVE